MTPLATKFFEIYEKSLSEGAVSTVAALYSDVFMFGGPRGVQSVKKEDFLKLLPGRKAYFNSIGLENSTVSSIDEIPLDGKYILARVVWKMSLKLSAETSRQFETKATYILEIKNETPVIVMQLDHQDLGETVNEMRAT
ncbi:MAG: hypothetical protein ACLPWG_13680 [Steroidobacteraceae bacterium]